MWCVTNLARTQFYLYRLRFTALYPPERQGHDLTTLCKGELSLKNEGAPGGARTHMLRDFKPALIHFSYRGIGAKGRGRTGHTGIFSPVLYQLSYLGIRGGGGRNRTSHACRLLPGSPPGQGGESGEAGRCCASVLLTDCPPWASPPETKAGHRGIEPRRRSDLESNPLTQSVTQVQ